MPSVGLAPDVADSILAALCIGVPWPPPAEIYVQLHTDIPGSDGLSNQAGNTLRLLVSFAPTGIGTGVAANTSLLMWNNVPVTERYTHFSAWDDLTAGSFQFSGTVTQASAGPVANGDDFYAGPGALTASLNVAS